MADLPSVLEYTTVHVTIEDLVENATTATRGKITYTPDVTTIPGIDGKIHQVETVRDHLISGSSSVQLLTGITWTASLALQGDIPAPDPITFTTDAATINLAYVATAAATTPVETRTVVLAGAATTADLDSLAAAINDELADKQDAATLEADTAALVGTGGALDTSLDARIAAAVSPAFRGAIVFLGDSITAYEVDTAKAWHYQMCAQSGGRLIHYGEHFAAAGYTLAQIQSALLPDVLALSPRPARAVIAGGTNDVGAAGYSESASWTTLLEMIAALEGVGIRPVLWTLPPRDDSATVNTYVAKWNAKVRIYAALNGYEFIDAWAALVDDTTGLYQTALALDSVHPNLAGHMTVGKLAAQADWVQNLPVVAHLTAADLAADPSSMVNPTGRLIFTDGVNGSGVPTGWVEYSAANHSDSVQPDSGIPGNWFRVSRLLSEGTGGGGFQYTIASSVSEGDLIYLAIRYRFDNGDSITSHGGQAFATTLNGASASGTLKFMYSPGNAEGIAAALQRVPAGKDGLRLDFGMVNPGGGITADTDLDFAQWTVVNLTALGLDPGA